MPLGWAAVIGGVVAYYLYNTMGAQAQAVQAPAAVPPVSNVAPPVNGPRYVEVGQGDSMSKIASAYGLSLEQMAMLNPDFGPKGKRSMNLIYPGEQLRVA